MRGERRPAFYALEGGGWRDYWTLLHPPYTLWHLSYVVLGAASAPEPRWGRLAATLAAFFLGVGVAAHALDEVRGRPLATRVPGGVLWASAAASLGGAVALGLAGAALVSPWLLAFVAFGAFIVVAYNLELFGGAFHSTAWFALAWGAFPALTSAFAQGGTLPGPAIPVAAACAALSVAQRRLSAPVRLLRRRAREVSGVVVLEGGRTVRLDEGALRAPAEAALRALSMSLPLLAAGAALARAL